MHHVLRIQELLAIIFNYTQSTASLAALARTCQAWSDLALDILWGRYGEVDHLVRLMPKELWKETGMLRKSLYFCPTRAVVPSDWVRFKQYHHRIRNVIASRISLDIWPRLSVNAPRDMILFPRIRSLTCTCNDIREVMLLPLFLGPRLRNLVVNISDEPQLPLIQFMCANVLQTCPDLASIHFSFPIDQPLLPKVSNIIEDFICQYRALEYLCLPRVALTTDTIRHIIRLPRLRTLTWSPESSSYPTDEDDFGFPTLVHYRHLETQNPRLDSIDSFLSTMTLLHPNTKISTLGVTLACTSTETQVKEALSLIINRCDPSTLTALNFYKPHFRAMLPLYSWTSDHRIRLHFDTLRPLLRFRNMQRLMLSGDSQQYGASCVFDDVDNDALQEMSNAWPHLTDFDLDVGGFKITLEGFLAFLEGCPNLENVQLTADFDPTHLKTKLEKLPRYPKMKILHVKDSILKDACRTADLFLALFPELRRIDCNSIGGCCDGWRIVNELMWRRSRRKNGLLSLSFP